MQLKDDSQPLPAGAIALDDLRSIDALVREYPEILSEQTLRNQLRNRDENGLASAVIRIGKRIQISKPRYEVWLGSRAGRSL